MMKKLLGAAAMAAVIFAIAPASAAGRMEGCSGPNLAKTETAVEAMADGDAKWMANREITAANAALLDGKMGACAVHLTKAAHAGDGMMHDGMMH
jgi:hypothetical protein